MPRTERLLTGGVRPGSAKRCTPPTLASAQTLAFLQPRASGTNKTATSLQQGAQRQNPGT